MMTGKEFQERMKTEREMLARNECPEGWLRCTECKRPRPHYTVSKDGICNGCHQQRAEAEMSDEIDKRPILPPWARRRR